MKLILTILYTVVAIQQASALSAEKNLVAYAKPDDSKHSMEFNL